MQKRREIKSANEFMRVMCGKQSLEGCKTLGKPKRKHVQHEALEQEALFSWANMQLGLWPELKWMFAIPNGGSRNPIEAVNLKKQGVKKGVLDIQLPVPQGKYVGLWIEMKWGKNKTSEEQDEWIDAMRSYGHKVEICYSAESAINAIKQYLSN